MNNVSFIGIKCCGCRSCEQTCPVNAIAFEESEEGFFYPVINNEKCTSCGVCLKKCPVNEGIYENNDQKGYAAYSNDTKALRKSSSGGIFSVLATKVLEDGGVVFGCGEASPGKVSHIMIESIEELVLLQGSKYVESDMKGVYSLVKSQVKTGKKVLFSGTPCQVAGLRKFVGEADNLLAVDIICHGVPSRKMYNEYLKWFEHKNGGKIKEYHFRSKEKHDWSLTYRIVLDKKGKTKVYEAIGSLDPYYHHFLRGYTYRESCYRCTYACSQRCGDITIGDFWGIENVAANMYNENGVSAVLLNSEKGEKIWALIKDRVTSSEVSTEAIISNNGQLRHPTQRTAERDKIYIDLNEKGFQYIAENYKDKKEVLADGIRNLVPNKTRQKIKSMIKR